MPADVVVYRTPYCPYCVLAARLLSAEKIPFREVDVSGDPARRRWLAEVSGQRTVPQLFIQGRPIGGYTELAQLAHTGKLRALLAAPTAEPIADPHG